MTELLSTAPTLATPVHDWEIKRSFRLCERVSY